MVPMLMLMSALLVFFSIEVMQGSSYWLRVPVFLMGASFPAFILFLLLLLPTCNHGILSQEFCLMWLRK